MTKKKLLKHKSLIQWLDKLETQHNKKIDLGLKRVRKVYDNLKLDKISKTILSVAGTNGKGSTVAILSSICQKAHYKVGEFTSPHILHFNERIRINDKAVSDLEIVSAFEKIEENLNGISLSYFEYATLAACIIFKQNNVDITILEVGLGGRLDSVNIVDTDCAIITTIDIDHTNFLGNDIESIAFEKAGIMRENKPVIFGDINCPKAIINQAKKINAKLLYSDKFDKNKYQAPNLQGEYQLYNAATAIKALESLGQTLKVSETQINQGLMTVQLYGRLQTVSKNPDIIVDVSHNKQAAELLSQWLLKNPIQGKTIAVFAVLDDKKPIEWLDLFTDSIDIWCISSVQSERAMSSQKLLKTLSNSAQLILSFSSVSKAFKKAQVICDNKDRIIVFGSFYTVSEVMLS